MINTLSINGDKNKPDYNIKSGLLLFIRFIFLFVIQYNGLELVIMHIKDFINKKIPQMRDFFYLYIFTVIFEVFVSAN